MPWNRTPQGIYLNQQSINPGALADPYDTGGIIIKVPKTSKQQTWHLATLLSPFMTMFWCEHY